MRTFIPGHLVPGSFTDAIDNDVAIVRD